MFKKNLFCTIFFFTFVFSVWADSTKSLAIFDFKINSQNDISYMKKGLANLFSSRLSLPGKVILIDRTKINKSLQNNKNLSEHEVILKTGFETKADYILTGSVTEFAGAYSIDVKVFYIKNRSFLTFYDQAEKIDDIIEKTDIICAKINKKVFRRTTITFEKMKKEKVIDEVDLQRMHPEKMMPYQRQKDKKQKSWWKFW